MEQREILFRGQRSESNIAEKAGKWIEGYYVLETDKSRSRHFIYRSNIMGGYRTRVNPKTIGQYTGEHGIDNVKIFKKDIVVIPDEYPYFDDELPNYVGVVEWVFSGWQVVLQCVNSEKRGIKSGMNQGYLEDCSRYKIIGNKFENPELLK